MKSFFLVLLCQAALLGQYNSEMVAEKSYENSQLFFRSHYLNPFGLFGFKDVTAGLIKDPFLAVSINPADLPKNDSGDIMLYLDFRGDRTESMLVRDFVYPAYDVRTSFAPMPYPDYRLISTARSEPEPLVSFGFIARPFGNALRNGYVTGTYQVINEKDRYYTMPFWIYSPNLYLDAFGQSLDIRSALPVIERQSGRDELSNQAHLVSLSFGYAISDKVSAGISYNGVFHSREGGYANKNDNFYSGSSSWKNYNFESSEKKQNYSHTDISLGLMYKLREGTSFGVKAGLLSGVSEQSYQKDMTYRYQQNIPEVDSTWSFSSSYSHLKQNWKRDGTVKYFGLNLAHRVDDHKEISAYYRFQFGKEDIANNTAILDTSYYTSRYVYSYNQIWQWYKYKSNSFVSDQRTGTGDKREYKHQSMLSCRWELTPVTEVMFGISLNTCKRVIRTDEPVSATRKSANQSSSHQSTYDYSSASSLYEDKTLQWEYVSEEWALNIPVFVQHRFNSVFSLLVGVNRSLSGTEITDETLAIIRTRDNRENGNTTLQTNFGELYKDPPVSYSENKTDIIAGLLITLSPDFGVKLLCDPETEPEWRVAQWWLAFNVRL